MDARLCGFSLPNPTPLSTCVCVCVTLSLYIDIYHGGSERRTRLFRQVAFENPRST